jgi:diguanylate cyclase (GGDEF)-like protein
MTSLEAPRQLRITAWLERQSKPVIIAICLLLTAALGLADYKTGYEAYFAVFYLLPISIAAYFIGGRAGFCIGLLCALLRAEIEILTGKPYSHPLFFYWNSFSRLLTFSFVVIILAQLRRALQYEKMLARSDFLTGAANARSFHEAARLELQRVRRHKYPLTVVYMDVDNFKMVNDTHGHQAGDELLRAIVRTLRRHLRETDVVARLGGDEFALLLPATDEKAAAVANEKVRRRLMGMVAENNWPVTFSIGSLTCLGAPESVDAMLQRADDLAYEAKRDGKNTVRQSTLETLPPAYTAAP